MPHHQDTSIHEGQLAELTHWNNNPSRGKHPGAPPSTKATDFSATRPPPASSSASNPRGKVNLQMNDSERPTSTKPKTLITDKERATWVAMYRSLPGCSKAPLPASTESDGYTDHSGNRTPSRETATANITKTVPQWTNRCKCGHLCRSMEGLRSHWHTNDKCRRGRPAKETFDSSYVEVRADSQDEQRWQAVLATVGANVQVLVELWPVFTEEAYHEWFTGLRNIRREERSELLPLKMRRLRALNRELSTTLGIHTDTSLLDLCTRIVREDWEDTIRHSVSLACSENSVDLEELDTVRTLSSLLAREERRLAPVPSGQDNSTGMMMRLSTRRTSDPNTPDVECALLMRPMKPDIYME